MNEQPKQPPAALLSALITLIQKPDCDKAIPERTIVEEWGIDLMTLYGLQETLCLVYWPMQGKWYITQYGHIQGRAALKEASDGN